MTYAALEERTGRLAGHLARLGVRHGDRVALPLGNRVEMIESYLGVLRAGAIGVPLDPRATDAELAYFLEDSGATAIVAEEALLPRIAPPADGPPRLTVVVAATDRLPGDAPTGAVLFEALAGTDPGVPPRDDLGLDEPAWILYTSGTTGESKGVVSSQRGALWSVAAAYVPRFGLQREDRLLWPLPVCFPGFSPSPGGPWYRTLADCFGGERDVLEIQHPGVVHGDAVPRDWETLVDLHAATVREHVGDRPHVLLGYSMGGYPAHSVAARLASAGTPPSGLVIVDTYHVTPDREDEPWLLAMPARVPLEMGERFDRAVDDMSMAAFGAYARMTRGWRPEPTGVPTLLVRATERVPEMRTHGGREAHGGAGRTSWLEPYDTVDVPGDHRSMTETHARTTAEAIRAWLTALGTTPRTGDRNQTTGAG
ncbi:erythronolide synthase, modules 5 and 6 [Streptomyces himastatinicus ATCC 53653]|uniref:Erythronolide synthase, modules 5 and 6 n=1 Tax=Streptomyces himastatinicus ATCC 53653 TaxID=457427 RepID=D9WRW6_9ACTN|nr:alpha/beta fold hydrolase [Streptomyces himastatinicus]EFL28210.1 erythronolide synthase, modules 5 and 6 [Streptomyces himastatinicus ATCC 53653]